MNTMMNEILKKRIENIPYRITRIGNGANDAYNEGVRHGAEWMLSHMWISVDEALPEVDEEVLVMFPDRKNVVACRKERLTAIGCVTEWRNGDYTYDDAWINYWMPIPKLKKNNNE